jgi:hypothetical protein
MLAFATLLCGACAFANTLTAPFGQPQNNCTYSYTPPYSSCNVIGNDALYDVQMATMSISNGMATVSIYTNSGGVNDINHHVTLGAFTDSGVTLVPGDIFFYNPSAGYNPDDPTTTGNLQFAIALTSRGSIAAGDLYQIGGDIYTETAQQALMDGSDYYRRDETVLIGGSGDPASTGALTISNYGDGITNAEYEFTVTVPASSGLLSLVSNGQIGLLFSSADCGNAVIQGSIDVGNTNSISPASVAPLSTPEPGPGILILSGIVLLAVGRFRRRRAL